MLIVSGTLSLKVACKIVETDAIRSKDINIVLSKQIILKGDGSCYGQPSTSEDRNWMHFNLN